MDKKYLDSRKHVEESFIPKNLVKGKVNVTRWNNYQLEIYHYSMSSGTWNFTQGIVTDVHDSNHDNHKIIFDIKRNYSDFWYKFVHHSNGNEYLLCGEDYQGYTVINLTEKKEHIYFPESGYDGIAFCWTSVYPSPNCNILAVHGCYWGATYEVIFYDFSNPDKTPYKEIDREYCPYDCKGWLDDVTFIKLEEHEIRVSDGKSVHELSNEEQFKLEDEFLVDQTVTKYVEDREILYEVKI